MALRRGGLGGEHVLEVGEREASAGVTPASARIVSSRVSGVVGAVAWAGSVCTIGFEVVLLVLVMGLGTLR